MSETRVHRSVSVLRQTRLPHARWKLRRAAAVRQSTAARSNYSPAQTGSACHRVELQQLRSGASSEDEDDWLGGRYQRNRGAPTAVFSSGLIPFNLRVI